MTRAPSPADLARRTAPIQTATRTPLTAALVQPGALTSDERFKPMYTWGLLLSGMQPEARLLAHTLLWYARHTDGHIPPTYQPTVDQLEAATGLSPVRISTQIEILRQRGWLHLSRVTEGPRIGTPRFQLTIPALYLERIRGKRADRKAANERAATARRQAAH